MPDADDESTFSLIGGDVLARVERATGLLPQAGLAVGRRILFYAGLTWLPIFVPWAFIVWRAGDAAPEPLLRHFGVYARCLVAIPLFIAAEVFADAVIPRITRYFVTSGLVVDEDGFRSAIRRAERVRDSWLGSAILIGLTVLTVSSMAHSAAHSDALSWAVTEASASRGLTFMGHWYVYVTRPVFLYHGIRWLWRLVVWAVLLRGISRLELQLVPTHPDGAGGLGFLEQVPIVFAPFVFGVSTVMASRWGHEVLYHGTHVTEMQLPIGGFVVIVLVVFLAPLLVFSSNLRQLRRRALFEYGALVGRHGRFVQQRWIDGVAVDDGGLLSAPELGPVADTVALYEAITKIRPTAFRQGPVVALAAAALVPMVPVLAIEVPVRDLALKIAGALL